MLQLEPLLDRKPSKLSGGEQQRVALGRAMVRRPAGVPDGRAADQPRRGAARGHARGDQAPAGSELGTTMVYVTHDQIEAMALGHRIAILNKGRARAGRHADGGLRPAGDAVLRRASSARRR